MIPMKPEIVPLCTIVKVMLACIEHGATVQMATPMSGHAKMTLMRRVQDARSLAHYQWAKGPITAYNEMAKLTPILELGLRDGALRESVRDQGYTSPLVAWKSTFQKFGMTAIHANTGIPAWPRSISC